MRGVSRVHGREVGFGEGEALVDGGFEGMRRLLWR